MTQPTVSSLQDDGPSFMTAHAEATWLRQKLTAAKMRIADLEATIARMEANAAQATQNALGTYWDQDRRITELVAQVQELQWIAVSDHWPQEMQVVQTWRDGYQEVCVHRKGSFTTHNGLQVIAEYWRPLPAPPRGEREGEKL